jgi:hypothetical protein
MKNLVKISISVLAALSLAPATAFAGTYSPSGAGAAGPSTVEVRKGITLNCTLTATTNSNGTISSSGAPSGTSITNISLSGGLCSNISFTSFPYDISATSATGIIIHDVEVTGITGNCKGDLAATLSGGGLTFSHSNTIPSNPLGGSPCSMKGTVSTSPSASYTYP